MPSPPPPTDPVRSLASAERAALAPLLTRAFADDPVHRWIHPGEREWERAGARFFGALVEYFARHGGGAASRERGAVALWMAPEVHGGAPARARLALTLRLFASLGRRVGRGLRAGAALESLRGREPHWYLAILATDPALRGRGLASSALAPLLARADADALPVRLETAREANLAFYARFGFAPSGECRIGAGPRVWAMRRPPQPRRS
ncbi:MAG: GNAT family N-acetyltransferase [Proteobacteria bacterium]|nr:MAG: GNAT family N-acetyltransferase [Pseudomonadota bacterium]